MIPVLALIFSPYQDCSKFLLNAENDTVPGNLYFEEKLHFLETCDYVKLLYVLAISFEM